MFLPLVGPRPNHDIYPDVAHIRQHFKTMSLGSAVDAQGRYEGQWSAATYRRLDNQGEKCKSFIMPPDRLGM